MIAACSPYLALSQGDANRIFPGVCRIRSVGLLQQISMLLTSRASVTIRHNIQHDNWQRTHDRSGCASQSTSLYLRIVSILNYRSSICLMRGLIESMPRDVGDGDQGYCSASQAPERSLHASHVAARNNILISKDSFLCCSTGIYGSHQLLSNVHH